MLKDKLDVFLRAHYDKQDLEHGSCEHVAEEIVMYLNNEFEDKRWIKVSVDEDGQNKGTVMSSK
jgi:hypothetical protein